MKKAGYLFTNAYLLLIFGVYPFYMKAGYVDIGKAKYQFFICFSLGAAIIFALISLLLGIQAFLLHRRKRSSLPDHPHALPVRPCLLSSTDLAVLLFASEVFFSFALSDYRGEALTGTQGWYMGLVLLLTLCGLYFFISRLWRSGKLIWHVAVLASSLVFLLGILDRFSLHLIPLEIRRSDFISTLGNINWFCGYLSVLAPIGVCAFVLQEEVPHRPYVLLRRLLSVFCVLISFMAGFCQGSDSVFLFWGALFFMLLWICTKKSEWLSNFLLLLSLWCLSAWGVRLLYFLLPDGYNYEPDSLCFSLAKSNVVLLPGLLGLALYICAKKAGFRPFRHRIPEKAAHRLMTALLVTGLLLWLILSLVNTWKGIPPLSGSSLFLLDASWGNGRGAAFRVGYDLFLKMPPAKKLFGAGPDCFSAYAYSLPEIAAELTDIFGDSRLTNAHNELLTSLVNLGLLGTFSYYGIFISFIIRCLKTGRNGKDNYFYPYTGAVCILCYLAHNTVSFAQVLNLPFAFLILGMGESILRTCENQSK